MPKQAETPVVSVILPTWNCADLLREAIESVRAQTIESWELIIINNFSTDHTHDVIKSFNDIRIKLIDFDNGGVIAAARNRGITFAKGDFIAFLDSDDYWLPDKLAICLRHFTEKKADLVCHGERHFRIDGNNKRTEWDVFYGREQAINFESLLYRGNFLSTSAVMVKTEILKELGGFVTAANIVTAEDYELWLRLLAAGARVQMVHQILGAYRIHSGSASSSLAKHLRAVRQVVVEHHKNYVSPRGKILTWPYIKRLTRLTLSSSKALIFKGAYKSSVSFILESARLSC